MQRSHLPTHECLLSLVKLGLGRKGLALPGQNRNVETTACQTSPPHTAAPPPANSLLPPSGTTKTRGHQTEPGRGQGVTRWPRPRSFALRDLDF